MIWNEKPLIEQYEKRIALIQSAYVELKSTHAEELSRAITQYDKLMDEYQRLVRVMHPAVQSVELPGERKEEAKSDVPVFSGITRWERLRAQAIWEQEEAAKRANENRESMKVEEKQNGSV